MLATLLLAFAPPHLIAIPPSDGRVTLPRVAACAHPEHAGQRLVVREAFGRVGSLAEDAGPFVRVVEARRREFTPSSVRAWPVALHFEQDGALGPLTILRGPEDVAQATEERKLPVPCRELGLLEGQLVDASGAPVAHQIVIARFAPEVARKRFTLALDDPAKAEALGVELARYAERLGVTDAAGRFHIVVPESGGVRELALAVPGLPARVFQERVEVQGAALPSSGLPMYEVDPGGELVRLVFEGPESRAFQAALPTSSRVGVNMSGTGAVAPRWRTELNGGTGASLVEPFDGHQGVSWGVSVEGASRLGEALAMQSLGRTTGFGGVAVVRGAEGSLFVRVPTEPDGGRFALAFRTSDGRRAHVGIDSDTGNASGPRQVYVEVPQAAALHDVRFAFDNLKALAAFDLQVLDANDVLVARSTGGVVGCFPSGDDLRQGILVEGLSPGVYRLDVRAWPILSAASNSVPPQAASVKFRVPSEMNSTVPLDVAIPLLDARYVDVRLRAEGHTEHLAEAYLVVRELSSGMEVLRSAEGRDFRIGLRLVPGRYELELWRSGRVVVRELEVPELPADASLSIAVSIDLSDA